ncbi:exportin-1 [Histomonas meleagridis]|uniref:exportin-1 n=1 Tax=Histomonas meleagridis TaxID=135588 RepID=UPI0035598991|nr:exportin-1 [Histomonas meleagridis]KAH0804246.1 exportin-1 [Histomonas meleagridis]
MYAQFQAEFPKIVLYIQGSLDNPRSEMEVKVILKNLRYFVKATDLAAIIDSDIIDLICRRHLQNPKLVPCCLSAIGDIFSTNNFLLSSPQIISRIFLVIVAVVEPAFCDQSLSRVPETYGITIDDFVHTFTVSIISFITSFYQVLETETVEAYSKVLQWLCFITANACQDDFRLCIELWFTLTRAVYSERVSAHLDYCPVYVPIFAMLRRIGISKMEKPSEVIISIDEEGIHSRRLDSSTEATVAYTHMREMLVYLTHIDQNDMMEALVQRVNEVTQSEWNPNAINSLCWAIGSLSGALPEKEELNFISNILSYLIRACMQLSDIPARAIAASGVMYICSQYSRVLIQSWQLLKTVLMKLFDFMKEPIPAVQDSAVESFKNIARFCRSEIIKKQPSEQASFLDMMLSNMGEILQPLSLENVIGTFEAVVMIIQCITDEKQRTEKAAVLCGGINGTLESLKSNVQLLNDQWHEQFLFVLQCNAGLAKYLGCTFIPNQLSNILPALMEIYQRTSALLLECAVKNALALKEASMLRSINAGIARLLDTSVSNCGNSTPIIQFILPPVLQVIVPDYQNSPAKVPEVVGLMAALTMKIPGEIQASIQMIFATVFQPTVPLIQDMNDNFAFKKEFNRLMSSLVSNCTSFLTCVQIDDVVLFMNCLKLLCGNTQPEISEKSLQIASNLINMLEARTPPQFIAQFHDFFAVDFLVFAFNLMTDSFHKFAFNQLTGLIRSLMQLPVMNNKMQQIVEMLTGVFPNTSPTDIYNFVLQMQSEAPSYTNFKNLMRNFLVEARKFSPKDPSLFAKEMEEVVQEIERKKNVPGLLPPSQNPQLLEEIEQLTSFVGNMSLRL